MILVIDNYDSFTYNLVQYLGELEQEVQVFRNDAISLEEIRQLKPDQILISPGPCSPAEAGISCEVIKTFAGEIPLLGVCLGHQCIGHVFGANVVRAERLMHGKTSLMHHDGTGLFQHMPQPFEATRYHSLIVERASVPEVLKVTCQTDQDEIMGLQHVSLPVYGVQFHPESVLTHDGRRLLSNFLSFP